MRNALIILLGLLFSISSCTPSVLKEYKQAKNAVARSENSIHLKFRPKRWRFLSSDEDVKLIMSLVQKVEIVVLTEKESASDYTQKRINKFSETIKGLPSEPLIKVVSDDTHVNIFEMPFKQDYLMCLIDTEDEFIIVEAKMRIQDILQLANKPELLTKLTD